MQTGCLIYGFSMDITNIFKHSPNQDFELRHSLRSIDQHAPYIRKIWILGDRPSFLSDDKSLIEHVSEKDMAQLLGVELPINNFFLLMVLSSLIPDLSFEFLLFSDDFFLLKDYPLELARNDRYVENLTVEWPRPRGKGLWREHLWRTRDLLVRLGYTAYNFEIHAPMYMTKKRVLDAYHQFREYVARERFSGMMGISAVLNHAIKHEYVAGKRPELISLHSEKSKCGFWGKAPASYQALLDETYGKRFFNFDDEAFGDDIARFLQERFPNRSKYEKDMP